MYGRIFCLLLCIEVIKMGAVIVSAVKEFSRSKRAVLPRDSQKSKIFRKDWARLTESGKHNMNSLQEAMIILIENNAPLPAEWKDHPLKGSMQGKRECHVKGDLLLIYTIEGETVTFHRAGTHAELFP